MGMFDGGFTPGRIGLDVATLGGAEVWNAAPGLVGDLTGANKLADAQGAAAAAELAQQRENRSMALKYAAPSPDELAQLQQSVTLNRQDIARKQTLLDSITPQIQSILAGKNSATATAGANDLAQSRKSLENTLAQRLGSDYATTSAGIQALNNFDQQAASTKANLNQQSLSQLYGMQSDASQTSIGNSSKLASQFGDVYSARNINAINQNPINPGLQYAGDTAKYGAQVGLFNTLAGAGVSGLASGYGGGMAKKSA